MNGKELFSRVRLFAATLRRTTFSQSLEVMKMKKIRFLLALAFISSVTPWASEAQVAAEPAHDVVSVSEVEWEPLNPARGEKSPRAGTLWGDRKAPVATGFLVKFLDGFSSPPHIHNVSYRGVVISGLIHNDDPDAAHMWMPTGSFWTQPKGEVHITAAKGKTNVAYIEIEDGPYLVRPVEDAYDSGERPINVDVSNIVWLDRPGSPASGNGPQVAFLWGTPRSDQRNGSLLKLPAGFRGKIHSRASTFRAVVIQGQLQYQRSGDTDVEVLEPGSYFGLKGESKHRISSAEQAESIIYVRTNGEYDVISGQSYR